MCNLHMLTPRILLRIHLFAHTTRVLNSPMQFQVSVQVVLGREGLAAVSAPGVSTGVVHDLAGSGVGGVHVSLQVFGGEEASAA